MNFDQICTLVDSIFCVFGHCKCKFEFANSSPRSDQNEKSHATVVLLIFFVFYITLILGSLLGVLFQFENQEFDCLVRGLASLFEHKILRIYGT